MVSHKLYTSTNNRIRRTMGKYNNNGISWYRVLRGISSGSLLLSLEREHHPRLPRSYVQLRIPPIWPGIVVSDWPLCCPESLPLPIPLLRLQFWEVEGVRDVILVLGLLVPGWVWQHWRLGVFCSLKAGGKVGMPHFRLSWQCWRVPVFCGRVCGRV